jgi:phenylpropionate dioxygenase-like ring-hydroxylating dioxygenase large terminal subunit
MNIQTEAWAAHRGPPEIGGLVQDARVHSAIYTDPALFELELSRIFGRAWLLIGHSSEVRASGDYRLRKMGRASVIMVRGEDGKVRVLMNRCRHRGSQVCESEAGNAKVFRCWYHGWTYDSSGKLVVVSAPAGYGADFRREDMGLTAAPRVDEYRGFVFASLSPQGLSLDESLGRAKAIIDLLIDASPTGEIFVDGGIHKTLYRGNWKLVGMDGYHPNFVHASVVQAWKRNAESGLAATHREDPFVDEARTVTRDLGNGHVMLDFRKHRIAHYDAHCAFMRKIPGGDAYITDMHRAHGEERARLLISLSGDPHVGIFPNMQLIHNQVRIVNPLRVDETEVVMIAVRLGGVSDEMNAARLRTHESFYGPAGAGSPDDAEIFERVQRGLMAEVDPWIELSRGMERESVDADGSIVGKITDEVTQRGQIRRWRELMQQP